MSLVKCAKLYSYWVGFSDSFVDYFSYIPYSFIYNLRFRVDLSKSDIEEPPTDVLLGTLLFM